MSGVGITGTRHGLTTVQASRLATELAYQYADLERRTLHHGDCVGADAHAANLAVSLGFKLCSHPPTSDSHRAFVQSDHVLPARPYLQRNRAIVDASAYLIACPDGPERLRSGTWSTVRYARSTHCQGLVIFPDGTTEPIMT